MKKTNLMLLLAAMCAAPSYCQAEDNVLTKKEIKQASPVVWGERSHVRRVDRACPSCVSLSGCLFLHPALDPHPLSLGCVGEQLPAGQLLHSQKPINIY